MTTWRKVGCCLIAAVAAGISLTASATSYTWIGEADGNWEDAENWMPNTGYPSAETDAATIPNPADGAITVTVNTPFKIATLSVGGTKDCAGTATLEFKTGLATNEVTGSVTVGSNGVLTHFGPNATITQRLALKVGGSMNIAPGGSVDVCKKGYPDHKGPGNKRCSPLYGGETEDFCNWSNPLSNGRCYGSIREPLDYGSGTHDGGSPTMGAGSIYLDVADLLTVNGTLTASASHGEKNSWIGAPGSIYVKCGRIFGSGDIEARAGYAAYGASACTSGGRIAVYLRSAGAALADFTGNLRTGRKDAVNGTCGTIYAETSGDRPGEGTLIIDNDGNLARGNQTGQRYLCTTIDPQVTDSSEPFGSVVVRKGGHIKICNGGTLRVTKALSVDAASRLTATAGHVVEFVGDEDCTVTGGANMTLESLVCTNAGKTIRFGTAAADKITIKKGKSLVLRGTAEKPIVLRSATEGTKWSISVDADAAVADAAFVNVKDSDATSGACVLSVGGTNLGNNGYWGFSPAIAPGEAIAWTGAADTAWQNPANWSRTRIPVASDVITVPTVASGKYPTLGYGTYCFNRLTVEAGATLTVDTATTTVTNALRVAGALVFNGAESFSVGGDLDFTGGAVTAGSSRIYLSGAGDQTLEADGNTFNLLQWAKPSGDLSFGTTDCSAANLGCSVSVAAKITFAAGRTYTFPAMTLAGTSARLLRLVSSSPGTQWKLVTTSTGQGVSGVEAHDCDAADGAKIMAGRQSSTDNCDNWDTVTEVASWLGGSGSFTDAAKWSTGAVPGAGSLVMIAGGDQEVLTVTLPKDAPVTLGSLTVKGSTGGKATLVANSPVTVVGDLEVWDCGVVELNCYDNAGDAPNTVTNNLRVRAGGVLSHTKGTSNTQDKMLHLRVLGDVQVDEGGAISATGKGFPQAKGPGYGSGNCIGASFASYGYGHNRKPYGSILRPVSWGSSTDRNYSAGGAVHLVVDGTLEVNGTVEADGGSCAGDVYTMCGGSVWIECAELTGSGLVTARESAYNGRNLIDTKGSGGRIAVYQRTATDFAAFPKERILTHRNTWNAPGTVYLESADTSNGVDLYVMAVSDNASLKTPFPMPDDGSDYSIYSNVNVHVGSASILSVGNLTGAAMYPIRSLDVANGGKVEFVSGASLGVRTGFAVDTKSSVSFLGGNTLDLYGAETATLTGFARTSGLAALVCTTPGKTIAFGTAATDAIAITGENALTLKGSADEPVMLLPADGTGTWLLNVSGSAVVDLRNVAVSNSNASAGSAVTAINSTDLGGNTYWAFSDEILPGAPITWCGGESADWSAAGNWDLGRTPVGTDYITVPALAGEGANYPTLGEGVLSYARITVDAGATLSLAGSTLSVTNLFTVHGSLVCTGATTVLLPGDADFTDGTVSAGAALFRVTGEGDQALDFGDATLNNIVFEKPSGNVSFGAHGFTAASFRCFTSAALDFTFASGATYDFAQFYVNGAGYPESPVRFRASADGTRWNLRVRDNAHALGGVSVRDCNASDRTLYAGIRCEDALNNANVDFEQDVAVYVGGASGDFMTAANWSSGAVPGADTVVQVAAGNGDSTVLTLAAAAGAQTVKALYVGGVGGGKANLIAKAPLVVQGDAEVRDGATLTLDAYDNGGVAPNVIGNDLHVASGGLITHTGPANTENAKVHLKVCGNATVDAGGAIDVSKRGYSLKYGPGHTTDQGYSPSYGGWGNTLGDSNLPPYGSILRPFAWGSSGCQNGQPLGGGAVRLEVGGSLTLDGEIKAEGGGGTHYTGTGGSIWITCGTLSGGGMINARTGTATNPDTRYTGAGGRIAVYQTVGTDFTAFPPERIFAGRDMYSAPGTVYLESADASNGSDLYVLGTSNSTAHKTPFPMPDDGADYSIYANVNVHVGIAAVLAIGERTGAATYPIRSLEVLNGGKAELVAGSTLMTRCGVTVGNKSTLDLAGCGLDLVGDEAATLEGFTRVSNLGALVCTSAGKVVSVATNAADKVTIENGAVITVEGSAEAPVTLLPLGGYGQWQIQIGSGAAQESTFRAVAISNSNASAGAALTAINSTDLGGNENWSFSEEILPGMLITWQGGASTAWGVAANWDRGRTPVATDYVLIPALAGEEPNYPVMGEGLQTFDRITVASGARLTLDGSTLTVTDQLNNHGEIVCLGAETVVLKGSADFAGGTMAPANMLLRISGTGDQTLDFGDVTLGDVIIEKTDGAVSFGAHGFTAPSLHCHTSRPTTLAFAAGATYDFGGFYVDGNVRLESTVPWTSWNIRVAAGRHALGAVTISDCNAEGATLCAGKLATDAGNNQNVDFARDVALWLGGDAGVFAAGENWSSGTVPDADTIVIMAPKRGVAEVATVLQGQTASVRTLSLEGPAKFVVKGALSVADSVTVGDGATLTLDSFSDAGAAPNVIGGDLNVLAGGQVTHSGPAATAAAKVHVKVCGDMTVASGASVTATGKGYTKGNGPGASPLSHCKGGAYAGFASGNTKSPYGSVLRPVDYGATVNRDLYPGGAIHLDVVGTLRVDGTVEADGLYNRANGSDVYSAGGGSVWIECGSLVGDGLVSAQEGPRDNDTAWKSQTVGSGGRIAVYQRTATDFAAFPKARMLTQRQLGTPCGTVFLAAAARQSKGADLYIDGKAGAEQETLLPMPADGDPKKAYADVNLHLGAHALVAVCSYNAATQAKSATTVKFRDLTLSASDSKLNLYGSTLQVMTLEHSKGRGWYKNYVDSQKAKLINLGGTAEAPGAIVWVSGMMLMVK